MKNYISPLMERMNISTADVITASTVLNDPVITDIQWDRPEI